jgi:hypothetical protein
VSKSKVQPGWTRSVSPFHEGERTVPERVGVAGKMDHLGTAVHSCLYAYMPICLYASRIANPEFRYDSSRDVTEDIRAGYLLSGEAFAPRCFERAHGQAVVADASLTRMPKFG